MLTLMGGYGFWNNDQVTVHLDAWHKLVLGWAEPRRFPLAAGGLAAVREGADGAIVLWDILRRSTEYFIVERRRPNAPGVKYDGKLPWDGALVWRVQNQVGRRRRALRGTKPHRRWQRRVASWPADARTRLGGRAVGWRANWHFRAFRMAQCK